MSADRTPMRILVTGSQGYIGSVLAPELARAGHDVSGLDTCFYEGCDFGPDLGAIPTTRRDVRDVTADDLRGFHAVVHLAALSNDPIGDLNERWTYDINLDATLRVARAAKEAGVKRFVFASSCSMYGASGTDDLLDENAPLRPLTAYAESKVRAEEGLAELGDCDFLTVSMRNATVYGVSPRLRLDIVLNNLAGWAHTTGRIRLLSDGRSWRPLIHVRDLTSAALALLEAPDDLVRGEAFNVGSDDQNYLVRDLAEVLADVTGCEIEFASDASPDPRSYRVDFSKLSHAFPAIRCDWDSRRGSEELVSAYRSVPLTAELFEGRRYVRLRQLRHLLDRGELQDGLRWTSNEATRAAS
jgi:nucleoside-diphosphate-sugar epimerase